jgi:hypothetical protein
MRHVATFLLVVALAAGAPPAFAVEYRLQVISLFERGMVSVLRPGELREGASGPGLDRMEASLDRGAVGAGAVLWDRRVRPVSDQVAKAWGAVPVRATVTPPPGEIGPLWDTVTWEAEPGTHSVWLVAPTGHFIRELYRVALRGAGSMRHHQPYALPRDAGQVGALRLPLNFVWFHEERGTIWSKYVAPRVDLAPGIAIVAAGDETSPSPDSVYLIVGHAPGPLTYKAVLGYRQRPVEHERPSMFDSVR